MKNVLINGGSRGIGSECVRLLTREGYNVAFTYAKSDEEALKLCAQCGAAAIRADSAKEEDIVRAVGEAKQRLGSVDILINCAAVAHFGLLTDMTSEEWDRIMRINLTAPFLYTKLLVPEMINKKQGRIINISSMWGVVGSSCEAAYSASKAGLIGLTKALAKELGPSGITVNAVAPGVIETDMNAHLSREDMAALADEAPLSRIGKPSEVAEAVMFLASERASFITGEVMNVSGGFVVY